MATTVAGKRAGRHQRRAVEAANTSPSSSSLPRSAHATDPDEAEAVVTAAFLPNRLELGIGQGELDMSLEDLSLGDVTIGRLTYGRAVGLVTEDASQFHLNTPVAGRALSTSGRSEPMVTAPGAAALFAPGEPAHILWSDDCEQICLMVPRGTLESELEELLDAPLTRPLRFDPAMDLTRSMGRSWGGVLKLVTAEFDHGPGLVSHPQTQGHVRRLLLDGLLLGHPHNYSEALSGGAMSGPRAAVAQAVELIQDRSADAWSSTSLARAVHISVRALQEGFNRDVGQAPMVYLRAVRLRRAHDRLLSADPHTATVAAVALRCGITHLGRFSAAYRAAFGELPSATLHRQ